MPKKRKEINPQQAKRVKELLDERGVKQITLTTANPHLDESLCWAAFSPTMLNEILNSKRPLTEESAKRILALVPSQDFSLEYLMGWSDFKNESEKIASVLWDFMGEIQDKEQSRKNQCVGFNLMMKPSGYQIINETNLLKTSMDAALSKAEKDSAEYREIIEDRETLDSMDVSYKLLKDGETVTRLNTDALDKLFSDVSTMVTVLLGRL